MTSSKRYKMNVKVRRYHHVNYIVNLIRELFSGKEIEVRVSDDGKYYGYVTTKDIEEACKSAPARIANKKSMLIARFGDNAHGFPLAQHEIIEIN
ncbi:50S ribosomal L9 C-terminal domain-containing protein [Vibrio lentus]|uniref:50S ribosomal L9 C-terminal domain-containing protein n=1 Tax=Vibrio lentus TaxID=136468 RepID=UPI001E42A7C2|nr:50S ribosomal L9 C-terminal domain-containing protein [Vibrio lentus]MCC4838012.1 hypothetical protein [Vibrio lentus]